jgi:hypothetical protein
MSPPDGSSSSMPENAKLEQLWGNGINVESVDKADLTKYTDWRISVYERKTWKRAEDLVDYYADDFKDFTRDAFNTCPVDVQKRLRDCLRERGVYVRKGRGIQVANELHKAVHEDSPWPDDDPDKPEQVLRATGASAPYDVRPLAQSVEPRAATPLVPQLRARERSAAPETADPTSAGRELANLAKLYGSVDMKYGGEPFDSLSYKYTIFMDLCDRADVPQGALLKAFPTMLKGLALDYYYSSCRGRYVTISDLYRAIEAYFENDDSKRTVLSQWNNMTLQSIIEKNPGKATTESLQILIKDLRHMQKGLDIELQSDRVLYNKIINACQQVSACSFACYRPSPTLAGLIGDLQSSITTFELAHKKEAPIYFVDRKYHKPGQPNSRFTLRPNSRKRCFVCQKEGCWSTKHTPEERQRSRTRFEQRFDKRIIDQYIEEYESHKDGPMEDEESEQGDDDVDDLNKAIEVLLTYDEPG